jgi:hypothetical protein
MKRLFTRHHNYIFLLIIIAFSIALISITLYNNKYKLNRDISKLNLFNIDTLIIVSHPSDETIWASSTLIDENCLVVCISCQNNKETKEFINILDKTNDLHLVLEYPEYKNNIRIDWNIHKDKLSKEIQTIIKTKKWNKIITHNPKGEYGNIHHKIINNIVTKNTSNKEKLYYFQEYHSKIEISNYLEYLTKIDDKKLQIKYNLISLYKDKEFLLESYSHIIPYEELISYRKWGE